MAPSRAEARRAAEALFAHAGDVLHAGVRVVSGRRGRPVAPADAPPPAGPAERARDAGDASAETARPAASGEDAAARIDAARERLRATIAPPVEVEESPDEAGG